MRLPAGLFNPVSAILDRPNHSDVGSSKRPSPTLPQMPNIMHDFSHNFSQSLEANNKTTGYPEQNDESRAKILNSSAKLDLYGSTRIDSPKRPHKTTTRRRYSLNRIHRTSSLTQRVQDLENAEQRRRDSQSAGGNGGGGGAGGCGCGHDEEPRVAVSDIIGSFGLFQMFVLLFSGLREGLVGYDALIMSVILQPETRFLCADNLQVQQQQQQQTQQSVDFEQLLKLENNLYKSNLSTSLNNWNETAQCYRSPDGGRSLQLNAEQQPVRCERWLFANATLELGPSLVAEWSLVCQYHWLVAFVESAFFFGLVTGNLVWGYYADKLGRRPAYLAAHTISLIFGSLSVVMPSIYLFTICRFLSAFGSIGYNIIYSIQVELIGSKHRSFSTTLNHLGWGLGVICIPLVDHLFDDYRPIIAVVPLLSLLM